MAASVWGVEGRRGAPWSCGIAVWEECKCYTSTVGVGVWRLLASLTPLWTTHMVAQRGGQVGVVHVGVVDWMVVDQPEKRLPSGGVRGLFHVCQEEVFSVCHLCRYLAHCL